MVRASDFTKERIALLNVPNDSKFRSTLRVYSLARTTAGATPLYEAIRAFITVTNNETQQITTITPQ